MPINSTAKCGHVADNHQVSAVPSDILNSSIIQSVMATRTLRGLVGDENQLGMKKVPMKINFKFNLFHVIPIISRAV